MRKGKYRKKSRGYRNVVTRREVSKTHACRKVLTFAGGEPYI